MMTPMRDICDFGDQLIRTRDLDPLYVGLVGAGLPEPQLCRYLLAYWCFYHVGLAAWLSQAEGWDFWHFMLVAAKNLDEPGMRPLDVGVWPGVQSPAKLDRWPRAAERRHFRGTKCVRAVEWLRDNGGPEDWVRSLSRPPLDDKSVMKVVQGWPQFGPWIAFKAADMMERVYGAPVSFNQDIGLMYEEPRAGLRMLIDLPGSGFNTLADAYGKLLTYFSAHAAPPTYLRPRWCGAQEVETVLCKWKSMKGGYYHVGKDIREHRAALAGWGSTAERILAAYPAEVP